MRCESNDTANKKVFLARMSQKVTINNGGEDGG
jgi:hypothetical protein